MHNTKPIYHYQTVHVWLIKTYNIRQYYSATSTMTISHVHPCFLYTQKSFSISAVLGVRDGLQFVRIEHSAQLRLKGFATRTNSCKF